MKGITLSPSQLTNFGWFLLGITGIYLEVYWFLLFPILFVYHVYMWRYHFNDKTIVEQKGIINVSHREVHYFRIKSIKVDEPLWMRFFGLSNVTIKTSDQYQPELRLYAVKGGLKIREELLNLMETERKQNGVREFDTYTMN